MLPDERQSKDNKHNYIGQIAFSCFLSLFFFLLYKSSEGWECSSGPQRSVVWHSQSMKGTKANAKSISPLLYTLLRRKTYWKRCLQEVWLWWKLPSHHWRDPWRGPAAPGLSSRDRSRRAETFFFILSPYGFECVHLSMGLAKTHCPLPHFWLILISVLHSYEWDIPKFD